MTKYKVYLVGSIQSAKDGGVGWRDKLSKSLEGFGFEVLNPCEAECNHSLAPTIEEQKIKLQNLKRHGEFPIWKATMSKIVKNDLVCVNQSEFLVVYYDTEQKLGGTIHEIVEAWQKGIPVYSVIKSPYIDCNDWTLFLLLDNGDKFGGKVFHSFKQLVHFLSTKYNSYIQEYQDSTRPHGMAGTDD